MRTFLVVVVGLLSCGRTAPVAVERQYAELHFKGLNTSDNPLTAAPGYCDVADNVVFLGTDQVGPRRGYTLSVHAGLKISRIAPFNGLIMALNPSSFVNVLYQGTNYNFNTGGIEQYSLSTNAFTATVLPPGIWPTNAGFSQILQPDALNNIRFAKAKKNLYLTSSQGVLRVETQAAVPLQAGVPAPWTTGSVSTGVSGGDWLAVGSSASYRAVLVYQDLNKNLLFSPPSPPLVLTNSTAGTGTPAVTVYLPGNAPPAWVNQWIYLYRTVSATSTGSLFDESFLVAQHQVVAPGDTAPAPGNFTFTDITTDAFLQTSSFPLYTNANTGVGLDHENDQPPLARDIAWSQPASRMFYVNTTSRQALSFQLLGVGSPNGLQAGDSITIGGVQFAAVTSGGGTAATPVYTNPQFNIVTGGSAASNIQQTAQNLAAEVTAWFARNPNQIVPPGYPPIFGYPFQLTYASGLYDPPGRLLLQELTVGNPSVSVSVSAHAAAWLGISTTAVNTVAITYPGRVYWSEPDLPESVPASNFKDIGAPEQPIYRVVATQDSVWFFKADGLYRLTGADPSIWSIDAFDTSAIIAAPDTAVANKSAVFVLLTRGPCVVTPSGVTPLGNPLRQDIRTLKAQAQSNIFSNAFGVVYPSEGRYILAMPVGPGDVGCSQQYVYDVDELGWTRWTIPNVVHGCVDPATDKLVFVTGDQLWIENKTGSSLDFNDNGAAFTSTVKFLPITAGDVAHLKDWRDVYFLLKQAEFPQATVGLESENQQLPSLFTQVGPTPYTWGNFAWGNAPWGAPTRNFIVHEDVPPALAQSALLGVTFQVSQANVNWMLSDTVVSYEESGWELTR